MGGGGSSPGSQDPQPRVDCMRCEVTRALERWSSRQGNLPAQNAAYRLAWGTITPRFSRFDLMQILLALLPLLAFICIFIFLKNRHSIDLTRRVLIHAAIWFGCYLVLGMEILSVFHWITVPGLVITWLVPIGVFVIWLWHKRTAGERVALPAIQFPGSWWNRFLLLIICVVLVTTALVAWVTPPQTWDALTYHLSRVAHWAQDRSIWHYATGIDRQTSMPPGAEELILNFYVLTHSDRLASLPQWFSMLGSLIGVSLIANYLGAKSRGQWLAAAFAATLPMGIVEASSTINDYVATFWVVCVVVECVAYYKQGENRSLIYISLAAGLAILTKPVAVPFLIPFALWLATLLVKRHGLVTALKWGAVAMLVIGLINAGYLIRNTITYGALSNPVDFETHYNQLHTIPGFIATVLKNIGMQVGLPRLEGLNHAWYVLILKIVVKLGLDINDPRMTSVGYFHVIAPSTSEDVASNPYHAYLIFALFIIMFFMTKKLGRSLILYGLLVASTFLLFSFIYKWNAFGTRYDLAFFVLFAPAAGIILEKFDQYKLGTLVTTLLLVGTFPWLFSINSRPLIIPPSNASGQKSILVDTRQNLYFANAPGVKDVYIRFTDSIKAEGCTDIGLMLKGDDPEYLLWVLMGAPSAPIRMEWIVSGPTDRYSLPDFKPCAIICRGCTREQSPLRGLVIAQQMGDTWLYLPPEK
jgi:hypothetical protein